MSEKNKILISKTDPSRSLILEKLCQCSWFNKTPVDIQKKLLELPTSFDGFLHSLYIRPINIGELEVLRMNNLVISDSMIIPSFEVRSNLTNEKLVYEYVSWKDGNSLMAKGIILIEINNQIRYFLANQNVKFSSASSTYESIGLYYPKFSDEKLISLPKKIENQIKKELKLININFKKFIDLGLIEPDPTMTNNQTQLYALVISIESEEQIQKVTNLNFVAIENIFSFSKKINDASFLSIIMRLLSLNIISYAKQ